MTPFGSLTRSLEENLIHRGSSLMTFLTSFHVVVSVICKMNRACHHRVESFRPSIGILGPV